MSYKNLLHKVTSAIYEEGTETAVVQAPLPTVAATVTPTVVPGYSTPSDGGQTNPVSYDTGSDFYNKLVEETNSDIVPVLKQLSDALKKLETVVIDEKQRLKAALVTCGVDVQSLIAGFDQLLAKLDEQSTIFNQQLQEHTNTEVTQKEQHCNDLDQQITSKQEEIKNLSAEKDQTRTEAITAKAKLEAAAHSFQDSFNRRKNELLTKKADLTRNLQ